MMKLDGYAYKNGKLYQKSHRDAKVGDLILIVERDSDFDPYKNGDILTVSSVDSEGDVIASEYDECFVLDDEFVVLEPVTQVSVNGQQYNVVKRKANVGDKVVVVRNQSWHVLEMFEIVNIARLDVDGVATERCGTWMCEGEYLVLEPVDELKPVDEPVKKSAKDYAKIGDLIKITGNSNAHRFEIGEIARVKKFHSGDDKNRNGVSVLVAEHLDGREWWNVQVDEFEVVSRDAVIEQLKQKAEDVEKCLTDLKGLLAAVEVLV